MAFQVSPGVEVKEIDLTNVIPAVSSSIGAFAGHFSWGPVGETQTVSSEKELAAMYGTPGTGNYTSFLQAASFLKYSNTLVVSRASDSNARNSAGGSSGHETTVVAIDNYENLSFGASDGIVHARYPGARGDSLKVFFAVPQNNSGLFTNVYSLRDQVSTAASTTAWAETEVDSDANDEVHVAVVDVDGLFTGVKGSILEVFEGLSMYADALKNGGSNYYATVVNRDSNYIYVNNAKFAVLFDNGAGDTDAVPGDNGSAGQSFGSLASTGTIGTLGAITVTGTDAVAGTYVVYDDDLGTSGAISGDGGGASLRVTVVDGSSADTVTAEIIDRGNGYAVSDTITIGSDKLGGSAGSTVEVTISGISTAYNFDIDLQNGVDATSAAANVVTALSEFNNPEAIDVNLVFAEQFEADTSVGGAINTLCGTTRKDCVGFISPDLSDDSAADVTGTLDYNNSYIVLDSSAVYVYNKYNDQYQYIYANGHIAGLCARTDNTNDPWFSPAGYNRGNLLGVTKLKWNPAKADRDTLYKAGINPVIAEPGQGILLFGDKTAQSKPSAFDRINVRRLFIVLEKAIATASKFQLFELNDEFTRAMFRNMTEPFLRDVKGRRGITDFLVVCDETNNTGDVIDTNRFVADIYIKPARSINFITLNFIATRTGVEFSEIVGTGN
jgi:phage tail sheath protein FI